MERQQFPCSICGELRNSKRALKRHQKSHSQIPAGGVREASKELDSHPVNEVTTNSIISGSDAAQQDFVIPESTCRAEVTLAAVDVPADDISPTFQSRRYRLWLPSP